MGKRTRKHINKQSTKGRNRRGSKKSKKSKKSRYTGKVYKGGYKGGYKPVLSGFGHTGKVDPFPPGGAYKVGGINGLNGGYYYSYNTSPTLQTEILTQGDNLGALQKLGQTLAPGVVGNASIEAHRGGRRKRTSRRKSRKSRRRVSKSTHRKYGKYGKRVKRGKHGKTKKGGSGLQSLVPSDVVDIGRNMSHGFGGIYRGLVGEKELISPDVMVQPIERY